VEDSLWLTVLGPVRAWRGDAEVELGSPQQRTVLAALLLRQGSQISMGELSDMLWGATAPANGHAVIRTYVSRLRQLLQPGQAVSTSLIRTVAGGYVLTPPADGFDLTVFRRKVASAEQARHTGDLQAAAALFGEALALWRGEALAGITGAHAETERAQLESQRVSAVAARLTTRLALGDHAGATPELMSLVDRHPLDERFREMLMLALYGSGQQAAALASYRSAQARLADELGVDPGPALRTLFERILRADPELLTTRTPRDHTTPPAPAAAELTTGLSQLPPRLAGFAGRQSELAHADALLTESDPHPGVIVISGTAGMGKTTFAVHWAHQLTERFPDGQLYLNLRGFDPTNSPMAATEAVRGLLELLGVGPRSIPESLGAMTALYRGLLADRRILLLLDNARLATQVRPLLPGNAGCLVIVTSRNQLTGLLAIDGARSLTLDVLTTSGAQALLTHRIGKPRTEAEPDAVREIIRRCAGLPLALAIVAAHCAARSRFPLTTITAALRERAGHLDTFSAQDSDTAADVRDVFSWSYHTLSPEAARLFRLVALHPGPDATSAAIASLAGLDQRTTQDLLVELTDANLLTEHVPGRCYNCHDLLRTYAGELAEAIDAPAERSAARHRVLDHYVHVAHTATQLFNPFREPLELPTPQPGAVLDVSLDEGSAFGWFTDEHPVLLAAAEYAAAHGFDLHAWQLAWALDTYLYRSGHWQDALVVHTGALQAAQRLADPVLQAKSHGFLGAAHNQLGRDDDALRHLTQALDIYQREGLLSGQADAHLNLGIVASAEGRSQDCIDHDQRSLAIYRQLGDARGSAAALSNLGREYGIIGEHDMALALTHQAVQRWTELGDRHARANCQDNLGYSHHHVGEHEQAAENFRSAIDTFRELGDHMNEAASLERLGDARDAAHDPAGARIAWSHALAIVEQNGHQDTTALRAKLRQPADLTHTMDSSS
jgi:DNA-binding SARP family transcriptional activator/tetratricopeptide (TPR) repeat protein